jgi:hypothetical protein
MPRAAVAMRTRLSDISPERFEIALIVSSTELTGLAALFRTFRTSFAVGRLFKTARVTCSDVDCEPDFKKSLLGGVMPSSRIVPIVLRARIRPIFLASFTVMIHNIA